MIGMVAATVTYRLVVRGNLGTLEDEQARVSDERASGTHQHRAQRERVISS